MDNTEGETVEPHKDDAETQREAAKSESTDSQIKVGKDVREWLGIAKSIADKMPDKFFPKALTDKVSPELASKIAMGIGVLVEIIWFVFTRSRAIAMFDFLICLVGIYVALYAAKKGSLDKGPTILFASIGILLCIETIFYGLFCWHALGQVEAAEEFMREWSY